MARLQRNNTSGVHGMRLRLRETPTRRRLVIDYYWRTDGQLYAGSVDVGASPVQAVEAAQRKRYEYTGDRPELTPRQAWLRMRRSLEKRGGSLGA